MLKKIAIIISFILTISILLALGYYFYTNLPQKIVKYEGLELGITANEVKYRKGVPRIMHLSGFQSDEAVKTEESQPSEFSENLGKCISWNYFSDEGPALTVKFDVPNGHLVEIACRSEKEYGCEKVNNIGINSTETDIKKKLGKPSKETLDGLIKIIQYKKYNTEFSLKKEIVNQISVRKIDN